MRRRGSSSSTHQSCVNHDIIAFLVHWSSDPGSNLNENTRRCVSRAISSLRTHTARITCLADAVAVPYVGNYIGTQIANHLRQRDAPASVGTVGAAEPDGLRSGDWSASHGSPSVGRLPDMSAPSGGFASPRQPRAIIQSPGLALSGPSGGQRSDSDAEDDMLLRGGIHDVSRFDHASRSAAASGLGDRHNRGRGRGRGRSVGRGRNRALGSETGHALENSGSSVSQAHSTAPSAGLSARGAWRGRSRGRARGRGGGDTAVARKPPKEYVPKYRSGPHALLVALYLACEKGELFMLKRDLVQAAGSHADEPIEAPTSAVSASARYSGWSSMSTLIQKGLVSKVSNPARYSLTLVGLDLAKRLAGTSADTVAQTAHVYNPNQALDSRKPTKALEGNLPCSSSIANFQDAEAEKRRHFALDASAFSSNDVEHARSRISNLHQPCGSSSISGFFQAMEWGSPPFQRAPRNASTPGSPPMQVRDPVSRGKRTKGASKSSTQQLPAGQRPLRVRSNREVTYARGMALILVAEGYEPVAVQSCIDNILQSNEELCMDADMLCETLRRNLAHTGNSVQNVSLPELVSANPHCSAEQDCGVKNSSYPSNDTRLSPLVNVAAHSTSSSVEDCDSVSRRAKKRALKPSTFSNTEKRFRTDSDKLWADMATDVILDLVHDGHNVESCLRALKKVESEHEVEKQRILRAYLEDSIEEERTAESLGQSRNQLGSSRGLVPSMPEASLPNPGVRAVGLDPSTSTVYECDRCQRSISFCAKALHDSRCRRRLEAAVRGEPFRGEPRLEPTRQGDANTSVTRHEPAPSAESRENSLPVCSGLAPGRPALASTKPLSFAMLASAARGEAAKSEIVLLLDNREIFGSGSGRENYLAEMEAAMMRTELRVEHRELPVGDALFVARDVATGSEAVLDWIVERKTLPDLVSSIVSGRLSRQLWRMSTCGLSNRVLLIEGKARDLGAAAAAAGRTAAEVEAYLLDAHVCDGVFILRVKSMRETVDALVSMRRRLMRRFALATADEDALRFHAWRARAAAQVRCVSLRTVTALQLCAVPGVGGGASHRVVDAGMDTPLKIHERLVSADNEEEALEQLRCRERGLDGAHIRALSAASSKLVFSVFESSEYDTHLVE